MDTLATGAEEIHIEDIAYPPFTGPCFATYNSRVITNGSPGAWIKTLFATWCLNDWSDTSIRKSQSTVPSLCQFIHPAARNLSQLEKSRGDQQISPHVSAPGSLLDIPLTHKRGDAEAWSVRTNAAGLRRQTRPRNVSSLHETRSTGARRCISLQIMGMPGLSSKRSPATCLPQS